jgi:hypothetical protein
MIMIDEESQEKARSNQEWWLFDYYYSVNER